MGLGSALSIDLARAPHAPRRCRFSFLWGRFFILFRVTYSASGSCTAGKLSIHDRSLPNSNLSFGELKPFFSFVFHKLRLPPLRSNPRPRYIDIVKHGKSVKSLILRKHDFRTEWILFNSRNVRKRDNSLPFFPLSAVFCSPLFCLPNS